MINLPIQTSLIQGISKVIPNKQFQMGEQLQINEHIIWVQEKIKYQEYFANLIPSQQFNYQIRMAIVNNKIENNIQDQIDYFEKYQQFQIILDTFGDQKPKLLELSEQYIIIIIKNKGKLNKKQKISLFSVNLNLNKIELLGKVNVINYFCQRDYSTNNSLFLITQQDDQDLRITHFNLINNQFKKEYTRKSQNIPKKSWCLFFAHNYKKLIAKYNQDNIIYLCQSIKNDNLHPIIWNISEQTVSHITFLKMKIDQISLNFIPIFQENQFFCILSTNDMAHIIFQEVEINNTNSVKKCLFDLQKNNIDLTKVFNQSVQNIKNLFLFELISNITDFTNQSSLQIILFQSFSILESRFGEFLVASIIYSLKMSPALVVGIVRYLHVLLVLSYLEEFYIPIIENVWKYLPGIIEPANEIKEKQELNKNLIQWVEIKTGQSVLNQSDWQIAWILLCRLVGKYQYLKLI